MEGGHLTLPLAVLSIGAPLLGSDVRSKNIFSSKCGPQPPPCPSPIKKQWPQPSLNHLINTFETAFHVSHSGFRTEGMDCLYTYIKDSKI